jgi:hypothetical protein
VRDGCAERVAGSRGCASGDDVEMELATGASQANRSRAGADRERRDEHALLEDQLVRRQLGDAVRGDRAQEIDRRRRRGMEDQ